MSGPFRILYYYRSEDPAIIEAKHKDYAESLVLQEKAQAFARRFGAVPVFTEGMCPHLVGVSFPKDLPPPQNRRLWTDPKANDIRMWPKPKNIPSNLRKAAQQLHKEWMENWPADLAAPRTSHLLKAVGLSEQVMAGNAFQYFFHGEASWIICSMPLNLPEVKASEYDAGRAAWQLEEARIEHEMREALAAKMKPGVVVEVSDEVANEEPSA